MSFYSETVAELYLPNETYCICSRAFIRNDFTIRDEALDSGICEKQNFQIEPLTSCDVGETAPSVHEEKEDISCYCSASHTDNNYSTDEHDVGFLPRCVASFAGVKELSDSGADLSCVDALGQPLDCETAHARKERFGDGDPHKISPVKEVDCDAFEDCDDVAISWREFWTANGERLIWTSWIEKYSEYMDPSYLPKSSDEKAGPSIEDDTKFVFENASELPLSDPTGGVGDNLRADEGWNPLSPASPDETWTGNVRRKRRSYSENDRLLSPKSASGSVQRTVLTSDSMTNVTKLTNYDVDSSRLPSDSSRSSLSLPSTTHSSENNVSSVSGSLEREEFAGRENGNYDQHWQLLWKRHFDEQYALHYEAFVRDSRLKASRIVEKKRNKNPNKNNRKYINSVGYLLQSLKLDEKPEQCNGESPDGADSQEHSPPDQSVNVQNAPGSSGRDATVQSTTNKIENNDDDSDKSDEFPSKNPLKRLHEYDLDETNSEKVKAALSLLGLCYSEDVSHLTGEIIYSKKHLRQQNRQLEFPKVKKVKHIHFDDDGNPILNESEKIENAKEESSELIYVTDSSDEDAMPANVQKPSIANISKNEKDSFDAEEKTTDFDVDAEMEQNLLNDMDPDGPQKKTRSKKKKKRNAKNKKKGLKKKWDTSLSDLPAEFATNTSLAKYWYKRYSLFSKFDEGIILDSESWYSVTPEKIARAVAEQCRCDLIVDAFCGAGGNTIQFAFTCERVISIDIDPKKIEMAKHNAEIYGVADRIEFIVGDFFHLAKSLKADAIFLSPPWGGPEYTKMETYDLETLTPEPGSKLLSVARTVSENAVIFLPRNSDTNQLVKMAGEGNSVKIEQVFLDKKLVGLMAHYGHFATDEHYEYNAIL